MKYAEIKAYARNLRKNQTPSEAKLWQYIRNKQLDGRKFLRQHPLLYEFSKKEFFFFIPDFYCYQERLIIEVDGSVHDYQVSKDDKREKILIQAGFKVLRFKNNELNDINKVLDKIKVEFNKEEEANFNRIGLTNFKKL